MPILRSLPIQLFRSCATTPVVNGTKAPQPSIAAELARAALVATGGAIGYSESLRRLPKEFLVLNQAENLPLLSEEVGKVLQLTAFLGFGTLIGALLSPIAVPVTVLTYYSEAARPTK